MKQNSRMFHMKERLLLRPQLSGVTALMLHHTVFILLLTCAGESSQPIVAMMGDDIVLPCQMERAVDASGLTVEWSRPDLDPRFVHLRRDSVELELEENPLYKGRTSLSTNRLKRGDVSLKLSKVKVSDEGTYRGFVPSGTPTDCVVQLAVGSVSSPDIKISKVSNGVLLVCKSKGWYPEPEVFWLDGEGNLLSAGPTETVRGPDDLYTVSSRVTVEKRHSNSFTCRVQQNSINQTRETETEIKVSADCFEATSCSAHVAVLVVFVLLFIVAAVCVVWKWRQIQTKERKKQQEDPTHQLMEDRKIMADMQEKLARLEEELKKKDETLQKKEETVKRKEEEEKDFEQEVYSKLTEQSEELQKQREKLRQQQTDMETNITVIEKEMQSVEKMAEGERFHKMKEITLTAKTHLNKRKQEDENLHLQTTIILKKTNEMMNMIPDRKK